MSTPLIPFIFFFLNSPLPSVEPLFHYFLNKYARDANERGRSVRLYPHHILSFVNSFSTEFRNPFLRGSLLDLSAADACSACPTLVSEVFKL